MLKALGWAGRFLVLVVSYVVLFSVGADLLGPRVAAPPDGGASPGALLALLAMAVIDVAILTFLIRASRLRGWRLMVLAGGFLYAVKTFTSSLEAAYFMRNVGAEMVPRLFAMTVPLCLLWPPLAVWVLGRARGGPGPAWAPLSWKGAALAWRIALLSCAVYPALFFTAGWFIAFRSPELRAFYGVAPGGSFTAHVAAAFAGDPALYPFECLRGLLWVLFAIPVLRATAGSWRVSTLLLALAFALVQNDVHLLPNPLMPPGVRLYHLVETASSNFLWAWCIGWVLARGMGRRKAGEGT